MAMSTFAIRVRRAVAVGALCAAGLGATGCASSASRQWAQNAPTIRGDTPAARQVQLGVWGEETPDEKRD